MEGRARRFRLGLLALFAGGLFVLLLGFILQKSSGREQASYFILFEANVKGMVVGSRVNFQGVPIGVVADMRFQQGKTLVELRVDPSRASIQDITLARMDRLLVTGQVTVELEGYGPTGKPLPAGSVIEVKEDPLHALTGSLPEVVDRASGVLRRLDGVLALAEQALGPGNQAHLTATLQHAERAAATVADRTLPALEATLLEARATLAAGRATAEAATSTVQGLARLEGDLRTLSQEYTAVATNLRGPAQNALAGLRSTMDDLRSLVRQLKLAPDSLLRGVQPAAPDGSER